MERGNSVNGDNNGFLFNVAFAFLVSRSCEITSEPDLMYHRRYIKMYLKILKCLWPLQCCHACTNNHQQKRLHSTCSQ